MVTTKREERAENVISMLPPMLSSELSRLARSRRGGLSELRELRLRTLGVCSVLFGSENITLSARLGRGEMDLLIRELSDGALYAHRDSISEGYITLDGGIRVGVIGTARYENRKVVGVSNISSAVFRFPRAVCAFGAELYDIWKSDPYVGMLIYSPPGVGKTTALRSLAASIGSGAGAMRVCVVDERCEFVDEDYRFAEVDILKGYKRREGIEIATRTMSPELVMIDELGGDDAASIAQVVRSGIPLVATAHARDFSELLQKRSLLPLMDCGAFGLFVGISRDGSNYSLTVDKR